MLQCYILKNMHSCSCRCPMNMLNPRTKCKVDSTVDSVVEALLDCWRLQKRIPLRLQMAYSMPICGGAQASLLRRQMFSSMVKWLEMHFLG